MRRTLTAVASIMLILGSAGLVGAQVARHRAYGVRCEQLGERLETLHRVGLDYLTLDRSGPTLSGGEAQRIRLASQLGSELSGVMYVLDEPSIGLHQRDNERLLSTLTRLRDIGNTVIVVEHDEEHVGRVLFGSEWFRPGRFGLVEGTANHAVESGAGFVFFEGHVILLCQSYR